MSSFTTRRVAAIAALALITPIGTGIAFADQLETDGDIIDGPSEILFGDICAGTSSTKQASIAIRRQGNNNVFANNAQVVFGLPTVTGHTTVTTATPATITLPNDWVTGGNRLSAIVSPNVTVTAGDTLAVDRQATISYNATGAQAPTVKEPSPPALTRDDPLTIKWNVVNCTPPDTTPPVVTVPGNQILEATSGAGAALSFTATANDDVDGPVTATCNPVSGSTFALGTTTVTCTATDNAGNEGSAGFTVKVQDTTAPTVTVSENLTAEATSLSGATVSYTNATATDTVDGSITASCTPASGSTFALGTTTVTCTATDNAGNKGSAGFTVTVKLRLSGFSSPVDMGGVINTVKSGSTVPLKFKVFAGSTEISDTASVKSFTVAAVGCATLGASAGEDAIEETTTGGTVLRYDATGGQFIQNWQTPKNKAGTCYRVTMTTQDLSSIVAFFKLK